MHLDAPLLARERRCRDGITLERFTFQTPAGPIVTDILDEGIEIKIEFIGKAEDVDEDGGVLSHRFENGLGLRVVRQILRSLSELHPNAELAYGFRIGGARRAAGHDGEYATWNLQSLFP